MHRQRVSGGASSEFPSSSFALPFALSVPSLADFAQFCSLHAFPTTPHFQPKQSWVKKLAAMQDIIDAWMLAQQKWMFLGPVYGSEEIAKQMPKVRVTMVHGVGDCMGVVLVVHSSTVQVHEGDVALPDQSS